MGQKVVLDINDIKVFIDGFNNAIACYGDTLWGMSLGCPLTSKLEGLKNIPKDILQLRLDTVKQVYTQLLDIEKKMLTGGNVMDNNTIELLKLFNQYDYAMEKIAEEIENGNTCGCFGINVFKDEFDDLTEEQIKKFEEEESDEFEIIVDWNLQIG